MPKGIFSQTVCLLLNQTISLNEIAKDLVTKFGEATVVETGADWHFGDPSLQYVYDRERNGTIIIDVVDRPWPDLMGSDDTDVFSVWTLGGFGPCTWPNGLERACQHSYHWEQGANSQAEHSAFIRIRTSWCLGGSEDDSILPDDYDAVPELEQLLQAVDLLIDRPEVICYFNPGGEMITDSTGFRRSLEFAQENQLAPLDLYSNIRFFNVDHDWSFMDSIGNYQIDRVDFEALFNSKYDPGEVGAFLRNSTSYLLSKGDDVLNDGDTMDGPGNCVWQVEVREESLAEAPRKVLRWRPMDGSVPPSA